MATNFHPSVDQDTEKEESFDLEALIPTNGDAHASRPSRKFSSRSCFRRLRELHVLQKILCYPSHGFLTIKPTSWLDGVRGVAAVEVFIFHAMGCWFSIVPAWHSNEDPTIDANIFQFPLIRTFFVSGGAAVCVFFVLSGYVLTHKSLRWIREGSRHQVYPALASSMFRRGFRLYLPPILITFCEMLVTRFGFIPPLNFNFVPEATLFAQFMDWVVDTFNFVNPVHNFRTALQGTIVHTKYDVVIWTIPLEFFGSFVCYTLLLILVWIPTNRVRMALVVTFSGFCMYIGSWNLFCFSSGMLLADFTLGQDENMTTPSPHSSRRGILWTILFAISFYIAGFPTILYGETPMPGFETLLSLTPKTLNLEDRARFWWSISGVCLLLSISQLARLKRLFETTFCQYLGRIAFSLYLVHEFCLVLFGLALQRFMKGLAGLESNAGADNLWFWVVCLVWYIMFTILVFALAARVEKWVDAPSVRFARWLEGVCLKCTRFAV